MSPLKRVFKIKAHQKLNEVQDNLLLYRALGNHVADQTADFACDNLFPELVQEMTMFHDDLTHQRDKSKLSLISIYFAADTCQS